MSIPGNLLTTAMAVMPHRDVEQALNLAMSLDIPFWPQLPLLNYYEDMYVQASEHFPGIILDLEQKKLQFSTEKFLQEIEESMTHFADPEYFDISETYSSVYHRFLNLDLSERPAIRGQLEGPISFGLNVVDENKRPIIYNDMVRPFMLEFMAQRMNVQLKKLKKMNKNAFMFVDEPGLQFIFSALSGYNDIIARNDMETFFSLVDRPRGVHLCGNPDWDFLLNLDLDILSLDIYTNQDAFTGYAQSIQKFLHRGGIIVWGIVPTNFEPFEKEQIITLEKRFESIWDTLIKKGIDRDILIAQSLLSPATCCLVNPDKELTVEKAFLMINELSKRLREKYKAG
jgi:hypothetical protein